MHNENSVHVLREYFAQSDSDQNQQTKAKTGRQQKDKSNGHA